MWNFSLSPLRACYWLIITDHFSYIFSTLNSHKKNWYACKTVSQDRSRLFENFLIYCITYRTRKYLWQKCASKFFLFLLEPLFCINSRELLIYVIALFLWTLLPRPLKVRVFSFYLNFKRLLRSCVPNKQKMFFKITLLLLCEFFFSESCLKEYI